MIYALVGHRGVGKTALLSRIEAHYKDANLPVICLDLDGEIEKFQGKSISDIFLSVGEEIFREMEQDVVGNLIELYGDSEDDVYICLGAGYKGPFPSGAEIIWVQRATDVDGRVFLDRPRLNSDETSINEYLSRYQKRRIHYMTHCSEEFNLEEGFISGNLVEPIFLGLKPGKLTGCLTLLPENFANKNSWKRFIKKRLKWGLDLFEVRDDYLSEEMMQWALATIPSENLLLSCREAHSQFFKNLDLSHFKWDWPLEFGSPNPEAMPSVLSLHERKSGESVTAAGERLQGQDPEGFSYLKLAIEINSFSELQMGHDWYQQDPERRSFLPRSATGTWSWYRLLNKGKMSINFVREALGSSMDQPTLSEWARIKLNSHGFAAVLGSPVYHSWTPAEHFDFFKQKNMLIVRISLDENEMTEETLHFLNQLGLRAAAVTSPLKQMAFSLCAETTQECQGFQSANTLAWDGERKLWVGSNTDGKGFEALTAGIEKDRSIAVWGGGGTVEPIRDRLPSASFYSARTGELKHGELSLPEILIWAVGRDRQSSCKWPPSQWSPHTVVDLNYSENSPGKEYAEKFGLKYISGEKMFRTQAAAQRVFWETYL